MKIISVEFANNPPAKQMYTDNLKWKDEILRIVKLVIANPSLGTKEADLNSLTKRDRKFVRKRNFHALDEQDNSYKDVGAIAVTVGLNDSNSEDVTKKPDPQRLIYAVYSITDPGHFNVHRDKNDGNIPYGKPVFPVLVTDDVRNATDLQKSSGEYGILLIIEIGGHYQHKDVNIDPATASALELWESDPILDEAFSADLLH